MMGGGAIPWAAWMAHGMGRLGLSSRAFWTMSVAEWRAVLGVNADVMMTRSELETLMQEHPDVSEHSQ